MKKKFFKKDRKVAKKSKTPVNKKKLVSKKKAARRVIVPTPEEVVTLGFESSAAVPIEPEALADAAAEAQEPSPEVDAVPL